MRALIVTAADELRERLRGLTVAKLITVCAGMRSDTTDAASPATAAKIALRSLARRHQQLSVEIGELDALLGPLVVAINPRLAEANGVGPEVAGQLLVTAGENHDRIGSDAAFAMLCGAAPIPASSGKQTGTDSTEAVTARPTPPSIAWCSAGCGGIRAPVPTPNDAPVKACRRRRSSAASNATSPESSTS
jgi:transposase